MSDQSNIGKGFLKDKLGEYQVNPPESVWSSVSARIGGRNNRRLFVLSLATAASVALAISLGINFFGPGPGDAEQLGALSKEETTSQTETMLPAETLIQEEESTQAESLSPAEKLSMAEPVSPAEDVSYGETRDREKLRDRVTEVMETIALDEELKDKSDPVELASVEPDIPENESLLDTVRVISLDPGDDLPLEQLPSLDLDKKKDPRWMLGAVLSPLYSFRDADGQAMAGGAEYETGLISYAGGINVSYRGKSRLAIESGIHFNKMGISIGAPGIHLFGRSFDFTPMMDASNSPELIAITNSVGNIVTESGQVIVNGYKLNSEYGTEALSNSDVADYTQVAEQGIEQHLDYLELPFNLRYTVVDRTFEFQLVGGMSTNFLVNNSVTMETESGTTDIGYLTNVRNVNYTGNAGFGMIYHIHEKFSFLLEPRFKYFLNSVNDASLPSTRPYAVAIYTGISYTF